MQKIIIKSWRKEWKRALAEYEEEQGIAEAERPPALMLNHVANSRQLSDGAPA